MKEPRKEIKDAAANYKVTVSRPIKYLMLLIDTPLKILTGHLQEHSPHTSTTLNLNKYLKSEATLKPYRFQISKNHMTDTVPPPNLGGSHNTTSYSGFHSIDKMNMHMNMFTPSAVCFMIKTSKQYKLHSISSVPTLQVGEAVTHIDFNGFVCTINYHQSNDLINLW